MVIRSKILSLEINSLYDHCLCEPSFIREGYLEGLTQIPLHSGPIDFLDSLVFGLRNETAWMRMGYIL